MKLTDQVDDDDDNIEKMAKYDAFVGDKLNINNIQDHKSNLIQIHENTKFPNIL